jgi:hypothetical protein
MTRRASNRESGGISRDESKRNRRCLRLGWLVASAFSPLPPANAQSQWIGASSNWNNPYNWSPTGVPGEDDQGLEAYVTNSLGLTQTVTYDYTGPAVALYGFDLTAYGNASEILSMSANSLTSQGEAIGGGGYPGTSFFGGAGIFEQSGGTNTILWPYTLLVGSTDFSTGTYVLSGTGVLSGWNENIGCDGTGYFNQSGGANTTTYLGIGGGPTGGGTYTLTGNGSLEAYGYEQLGGDYNTAGIFNQSGGTNIFGSELDIGPTSNSIGNYSLSGGTATTGGSVYVGGMHNGSGGEGLLTVCGTGVLNVSGGLVVYNTTGSTISLSGGTINTAALDFNGVPSLFNWTSGTLNLTSSVTFDSAAGSTTTSAAFGSSLTVGANQTLVVTGNEGLGGTGTFALTINSGGTHSVTGTLTVNSKGTLTQNGGNLSAAILNGNFTQTGGSAAFGQITGTGKLTINGGQTALTLNGGVSQVGGLSMSGLGTLDITNNELLIDYGSGPDPIASIAQWIANGYYNLPGPQIISSSIATADAASGLSYGIGYADGADGVVAGLPSGEIEIMFTLLGDANLDGTVNAEDFTLFSEHLGQSGVMWDDGDFNYDGTVNTEDFTLFSQNLGQSAAADGPLNAANSINLANVPEPACAGMITLAGFGILRRQRRI